MFKIKFVERERERAKLWAGQNQRSQVLVSQFKHFLEIRFPENFIREAF